MNDVLWQLEYCVPIGIAFLIAGLILSGVMCIINTRNPVAIAFVCVCIFCVLVGLGAMALRRWRYG